MVKAFYQSVHYEPVRDRFVRRAPPGNAVTFSERYPAVRTKILDYFEEMSAERVGVLHGDYLVHPTGMYLVDRKGSITAGCVSLEDPSISPWLSANLEQFDAEDFVDLRERKWSDILEAPGSPILCDLYEKNYFHFSLEMTPRVRYFPNTRYVPLVVASSGVSKKFQAELLQRSFPGMTYLVLNRYVRIRDPVLAHDAMSEEGVLWLREVSKISARPGGRRIYLRRSGRGTRMVPGGGISESAEFLAFLRDFGFEIVDTGNGELSVEEQVALLDGAGLILAAHGAALTNIAYLTAPVAILEVMSWNTARACFMHLAAMLNFRYHGVFCRTYDEQLDIVVDLDEISDAVKALS